MQNPLDHESFTFHKRKRANDSKIPNNLFGKCHLNQHTKSPQSVIQEPATAVNVNDTWQGKSYQPGKEQLLGEH